MKKIGGVLVLLSVNMIGMAQSFDEWFRQKKTQLKYLKAQIAAEEAFINSVEEGYQLVQKGTDVIGVLKKGDYDLHSEHFGSLSKVKLRVGQYAVMQAFSDLQGAIVHLSEEAIRNASSLPHWREMISDYFEELLGHVQADMDETKDLTTNDEASLTDAQRIDGIYEISLRMKKNYETAVELRNSVNILLFNLSK